MPGIVTNKGLAKAMGERASVDQGEISRWWHVQGDALPVDDPFTGDEMGVYSAYTPSMSPRPVINRVPK